MQKEDMQQVSFEELLSELSGSTSFGQDELIEMIALQDNNDKDFCIYHRHKAFCVPLHKIREFFVTHTKPVPPMTQDQELIYLREKVKKLQDEAEQFQEGAKVARPAPDEPEALAKEPEEGITPGEEAPVDDIGSKVVDGVEKGEFKTIPPKRDESIPPSGQREKKSLKEIRADLAKELKDVKPPKEKVTASAQSRDIQGREAQVDNLLKKK